MVSKFVVAALAIFFVAQANAGCLFAPPTCAGPALGYHHGLLNHGILNHGVPLPATLPCPPVPTKFTQKPDINVPIPIPEEIPIGNFCSCQKFGITPKLIPCAPAPVHAHAPAGVVYKSYAPAPVYAAAHPLSLAPGLLKTLLAGHHAPCAAPAFGCGCA